MKEDLYISGWCRIREEEVLLNHKKEAFEENFANFAAFIKALYKKEQISYPKFYKMDDLSKLGFMTAELLLKESDVLTKYGKEDIGVVIANSSSSMDTDLNYQELIRDRSNYFPSPAVFVYTLPNIMIGEICIRHRIRGENAFFVAQAFDPGQVIQYVMHLFGQEMISSCICGWVELLRDRYEALLFTVERKTDEITGTNVAPFDEENMNQIFNY
jgi:hypothetical protein